MKRAAYALIAVIPWCLHLPQSAPDSVGRVLRIPQSALRIPHSELRIPQSALRIQNSAIRTPQSAIRRARIMLLDGESGGPYHRWQITTPVLKAMLDETNLF